MLYSRALGHTFSNLPEPLQAFHSVEDAVFYTGRVTVTHGSALTRRIAMSGGMPGKSGEMPISFRATRDDMSERWERNFDGHITRSRQWLHSDGVIAERVGTSVFLMEPRVDGDTLRIPITGLRGFGLPMPRAVLSSCEGIEGVTADGHITFDVHASLRGLGLIIRYRGTLQRAA
ncbi:DUF4166 domain-containing protein [Jannaschia sp. CCS1]|uniref:DUF4166 domain-containing protein n=1 Tax=Jannaschia sp. (strain CCS1) TaxID=290400 RepID=UPI000053BE89|nr:DUF4166 domain-containing protein [Jannaschia sp. CCS1]ABD56373.1 hypothetical protein Jann_3456 [Jannaschia sp. CCS1]